MGDQALVQLTPLSTVNPVDAPRLPLEDLTETTFNLVAEHMLLRQIIDAAEGLIQLASHPTRPKPARLMPIDELQALLEKVVDLLEWQELEDDDDRSDTQKLIDNVTDADTVLVRDPSGTPELQEIAFLKTKTRCWMQHWRAGRPMARPWLTTAI